MPCGRIEKVIIEVSLVFLRISINDFQDCSQDWGMKKDIHFRSVAVVALSET